ncbi:MAG: hypothetical protein ACI9X4_002840, partial [Glaciecola sp.]
GVGVAFAVHKFDGALVAHGGFDGAQARGHLGAFGAAGGDGERALDGVDGFGERVGAGLFGAVQALFDPGGPNSRSMPCNLRHTRPRLPSPHSS